MSYDYKEKIVELLELVGDSDVVFLRRILIIIQRHIDRTGEH